MSLDGSSGGDIGPGLAVVGDTAVEGMDAAGVVACSDIVDACATGRASKLDGVCGVAVVVAAG